MTDQVFALGEHVEFTHSIHREREWVDGQGTTCTWITGEVVGDGYVVGWRTLSDGVIEAYRESDGYGGWVHVENQWRAKRYFRAYLVTVDLRTNPIYVLPEHMTHSRE